MTHPRLSEHDLLVTTGRSPSGALRARAAALAARLDLPFVSRGHESIERLTRDHARLAAVVLGDGGLRLVQDGRGHGFHPNMAPHRVRALEAGHGDRLVAAAGLGPGDQLLDCTCGLGADAAVASCVVGPAGGVEAVEASAVLAEIVAQGFARYDGGPRVLAEAMRRVRVVPGNNTDLLRSYPDSSRDIVYFDPMFKGTFDDAQGLDLVRRLATPGTPSRADVHEARRVARRCVVVKDRAPGLLLSAIEVPVVSDGQRVWYGRIAAAP